MIGKKNKNSLMTQVQAKLDKPLKDVISDLIQETQDIAEANRKLIKMTGIEIKYNTFWTWTQRLGIEIEVKVSVKR